jgi:hypothetical protein
MSGTGAEICVHCLHYQDRREVLKCSGDPIHTCIAPYVDRIDGELKKEFAFCRVRRMDPLQCGPTGEWFEEKPR